MDQLALLDIPIFQSLDKEHKRILLTEFTQESYRQGELLFEEGSFGDCLYIIQQGSVRISLNEGGEDRVIAVLQEKDCFGEMALLSGDPRSATACAEEDVVVLRLDKERFDRLLLQHGVMALHFAGIIARRLATVNRLSEERSTQLNDLKKESGTDPLTGLANRRTMNTYLEKWEKEWVSFTIIAIDIDRFKSINDTYGHGVGDEVLVFLANIMKKNSRETDLCCRYGGEEFMVFLPKTSIREAVHVAERLRQTMEETISPCGRPVTVSIGISHFPTCSEQVKEVIEQADKSLYEAKNTGRNRVVAYAMS